MDRSVRLTGEAEYRRLRARRAVRIWNGDDGMVHLYGQFDPVTGRRIRNRLRDAHRLLDADKKARAAAGETRSLKQCMADALENMTIRTADGGKPYADIALVARLDPDTEKLMVSTADGDPLPAGVIERLAGESSWFGLVLSVKGVPMWKGRNVRRATESQFQALMALYGGCAGCAEPDENKLNAHHMDPFARGGGTNLDNLLPLCWGCHSKIHDHHWQVVAIGDGRHTIKPPDRIQVLRPGAPARHRSPVRSAQTADAAPKPAAGFGRCQGRAYRAPSCPSRAPQGPSGSPRRRGCPCLSAAAGSLGLAGALLRLGGSANRQNPVASQRCDSRSRSLRPRAARATASLGGCENSHG